MTQRTTPPFRADHVGSLLRTAPLKDARAKHAKDAISAAQLKEIEDREIENIIKKQEDVGLKLATDGEFRRSWWHFDFFRGLQGVTPFTTEGGIQFHGVQTKQEGIKITSKMGFAAHPMLEHFKFLKAHTRVTPKMTIPAPSTLHFRQGRAQISTDVYPTLDPFFDDLAATYRDRDPARSTTPAAVTCSSTIRPGRWCAIRANVRIRKSAATNPTRCRRAMRGSPTRRSKASRPT